MWGSGSAPVFCLRSCMRMSLSRLTRRRCGRGRASASRGRASRARARGAGSPVFAWRMPPAGLKPTLRPVSSCTSRTASSMQSATGQRRGAGLTFPVDVLTKSAPPPSRAASRGARCRTSRARPSRGSPSGARRRTPPSPDDLVEHLRVAAGEKRAAVDHHVDLVGAELDRARTSASLTPTGTGRTGSPSRRLRPSRRCLRAFPCGRHQVRVDADRGE